MKYYFTTKKNLGEIIILHPRIPINRMNNEDDKTKRICVSQSINGCLTGMGGGVYIRDKIYIYECETENIFQPSLEQVPDRCFTGEQWILESVEMKKFMVIFITDLLFNSINEIDNPVYKFEILE